MAKNISLVFSTLTCTTGGSGKKKRSMKNVKRAAWMDKRLLVSNFANDNATELCNDEMSHGPDAVGSDGYFCDMAARELHPLCSLQDVHGCVNIDVNSNKITKRSTVAKRSVNLQYRSYDKLELIYTGEMVQ